MKRILIFGNSGSGKSTLARKLCQSNQLAHLDLDTIAWQPITPPERVPLEESLKHITVFTETYPNWIIEGCYSDLLELALPLANEVIFLNLSVEDCIANARNRPWEPHKYDSPEAQDRNLAMLIDWIAQYPQRTDTFSRASHEALYERFSGKKSMYTQNISA
jgi:adenylate kinase family enzyme